MILSRNDSVILVVVNCAAILAFFVVNSDCCNRLSEFGVSLRASAELLPIKLFEGVLFRADSIFVDELRLN